MRCLCGMWSAQAGDIGYGAVQLRYRSCRRQGSMRRPPRFLRSAAVDGALDGGGVGSAGVKKRELVW